MDTVLEISQLGNPVLRASAKRVDHIQHAEVQQLIDHLITTMLESAGVGIAAPQVGESLQIMVVASRPTLRYPQAPSMEPVAMINPELISQSDDLLKSWEGCLSIPGIRGQVPRSHSITIAYTDRHGHAHQQEFTDFVARIVQHEFDHLQGTVFVDRVESTQELMTEQEYQKQVFS
ncbi:Peptide deformylase [Acaryochloris thomasi RCC1774]|uniref:Peptide deformylase n=1 Tax=Acaryochloris thomasi RCC1774 TaxID=1764569 RepID=A0A2W1JCK8_9CYAN|nr:peptide deformylase [Acaryochloris thomasi]PZD71679.1 Peptide deformylase [Acaryochloris thomasi RCC1774]